MSTGDIRLYKLKNSLLTNKMAHVFTAPSDRTMFLFLFLMDLPMVKLIKLAKMAGVMHEADHAYSFRSTWRLHRLATDVPFIACVINLPFIFFAHYLELSSF